MQLRIERKMLPHVPWGLIFTAVTISLIGIWNLGSAARPPHVPVWSAQAVYLAVGLTLGAVVCLVDYKLLHRLALPFYLLNLVALLVLQFVGHKAKGAESWIVLGPLRVQPAEFMKIGVILMLAKFFHEDFRPGKEEYGLWRLLRPLAIFVVPFALVLIQPDLGTAMMIFLSSTTVILFAKVKKWLLATLVVGIAAASFVVWNDFVRELPEGQPTVLRHRLKRHQAQRISGWLNPEADLRGSNYHAAQSMIAVGSGELWGRGWGQGTQTGLSFLPEQHTDFIFSVWAEEHGFVLCLVLLVLYGLLLVLSLGVAYTARDRFGAFVAVGFAAMVFWQVFENVGMVTGLMPVTGITLPMMSYGGSSMVSMLVSLGLVVNVGMRRHIF